MQGIFEFLTYLWSVAGIPLLLFFIPGVFLDEISKVLEKPIRTGIRNELRSEWEATANELELSVFGKNVYERYRNKPQAWNRLINGLFFLGHALILLSGYLILGFLGLLFFFIMDSVFLYMRIKDPDVKEREKHVMDIEARTVVR